MCLTCYCATAERFKMSNWKIDRMPLCIRCGKEPKGRFACCDKCDELVTHEFAIKEDLNR